MEKNKGLFSFRKHPVGNFLDEKKGRKRKGGRLRRSMGFLMAAVLIFNTLPASGLAVSASEQEKGLCEHHRSHTAECGYAEAQPCTHEHGEECYKTVTECVHEHTDECYPETEESAGEGNATASDAEGREPENCTHQCSEESGCITKMLDCHHEHDESCGYKEAQDCGYVCEICNGIKSEDTENTEDTDTDTAKCICEILCTEDSINGDCPVCGTDDASFLDCKGKVPEENTENQEDTGICKHHQEHDADCGYIPKSEDGEGSPCTYECRICPIEDLIAALPEQVTEDNEEEVRAQLDEILALYRELDEDEQGQIDLSRCYELQEALDNANAPMTVAEEINISQNWNNILTADEGDCPGHTFTGTAQRARIYVESGAHDVTFSGLNITDSAMVGIAPGVTMNLTIEGTNTISAAINRAGIYVPVDAALTIDGAGSLDVSGSGDGAGIGGAVYAPDESGSDGNPNCGTVEINGGTVTATGGSTAAGIGGGIDTEGNPGNGGNVTINSGTVTATGGRDQNGYFGGAGIGGGSGDTAGGSGGTLTINGGHVTLTAGNSTSYGFGQGTGSAPGGTCELTLTDASYLAEGTTLDPKGKYTINGDPTADMIVVPELVYTGEVLDTSGIKIDDSKTGTGTYFGQTFTVKASAEGWTYTIDPSEVKAAGEYTATFKKGDKEISKTFTVAQSDTDLKTEGKVLTYNGDIQTTTFNADDTITVKATPTATGTAPQKAAARLRGGYTEPTTGQMALFVGDIQVSDPVGAGEGGTYTMTVSASEVLLQGNAEPNGNAITLTAKFVGNDNMADAVGTVDVRISAVAMAERDGAVIGYYGESNLASAFAAENTGATVTLLKDVDLGENDLTLLSGTFTLDCGAFTLSSSSEYFVIKLDNADLTFAGGTIQCNGTGNAVLCAIGTFTMTGGTLNAASDYALNCAYSGEANIQGGTVGTQGKGLCIGNPDTVKLSGGTYATICIVSNYGAQKVPLSTILADGRAAYGPDGPITRDTVDAELTGPIIVKECEHDGVTVQDQGNGKHGLDCPYCGYHYEHTTALTATASGNNVTLNGGCVTEGCNYAAELGTVSFTFENLVYGNPDAKVSWIKGGPTALGVMLKIDNALNYVVRSEEATHSCSLTNPNAEAGTPVTAKPHTMKVSFYDDGSIIGTKTVECELTFTVAPAPLTADMVTLSAESATYSGTEQKPALSVQQGETPLTGGTDYEVIYTRDGVVTNDFTSAGAVNITVTGKGNYTGTVMKEYAISKADVLADNLIYTEPADLVYTGQLKTAAVTANNLTGIGEITVKYRKDNSGNLLAEAKEPGTYYVYADISAGQNYNAAQIEMGSFTISYMATPTVLYNGGEKKDWYNRDVAISAGSTGYTVSDAVGGGYKPSYTISAQEGTVTKTLYFKDEAGHMSDSVEVTVKFDLTPPTGEIAVGAKWWQNVLHFLSFGNYAAKEYTVTIKAEDKNGSGISRIEYVIVTGSSQYTDVGALTSAVQESEWKEYDSSNRPTVSANTSQYVVYARLTDNVGNATYISTDGILLDSTAPTVGGLAVPEETKKDVTAGVTFTVSEAADYYYVVLPQGSAAPSAEDIIVTCGGTLPEGGTGTDIAGIVDSGKGAVSADTPGVSVEAENLQPYTEYIVYVTAIDRAVDITNSAEGTPAGNIADVVNTGFTTKKTLPVITKAPAVAGTYGQSVGEMTVTGGRAQAGSTVLAGTWTVSDADKNEKPSAGTSEVTVIFTPGNANYDSVPVQASLTVSQRNLNAEGVTVSEVAGNYTYTGSEIKPPVAVDTGTPTSGIYISDSGAALNANDFTVSYSNNKDAGTASVTITGKGNYTGSVTRTFTIGKASGREVPDVSGSHTDNGQTYTYTVTPTEGAVYRMDNGAWQAENIFKDIKPGTSVTFYAKMPEDKNYEEGTPKYITVDFPKLTPAAPALTYKADRTNPADVKVAIIPVSGAEYSFDGGKTWTESNEQGGFTTSQTVTLAIRLKETGTHNQSPVQTVTVDLAKKDREAPPVFSLKVEANGETDYTVTIPATEGCEYSFDGVTWSEVNVKTGISVGETVTGYKRYKETDDYNASSAVSAKETMPKFTVKTPVISPAGGSYTGSVSVAITCGSPDAEIYYTTDGSTPGRSSTRYTGAFTVSAPATVKAVAIKDGLNDSAVATVSYTKKDGGGSGGGNSGGSSGGNENNGGSGGNDEGQGSGGGGSTNPGNGNTTPQPSVTQPTDTNTNPGNETAPGTGTTPVNPGSGNTVRSGTAPGSGTGTPAQGTKQPFIKGEDGKTGWDVIRAEEEQAQEGSTINVDMNGSVVVPGDIFDSIKGKDITITFDMGNGILWSVDGKSITTDKAGDIDFSVKTETNAIPVDIVNNVTGENYSIQISLAYEGEFGFTAVLSIGLGRENAGYTASLYYYNESTGELEFICSDEVAEDGTVSLAFTHASDYVIAIDGGGEEESGNATEPEQPDTPDKDSTGQAEESPQAGQAWRPWWLIVVGALVIIMGIGVFFVVKKGKDGDSGQ